MKGFVIGVIIGCVLTLQGIDDKKQLQRLEKTYGENSYEVLQHLKGY